MSRANEGLSETSSSALGQTAPLAESLGALLPADLNAREVGLPALVSAAVLLAWEFLVPALGIEAYLLPTPSVIASAFLAKYPTILGALRVTLFEFFLGFSATVVAGYLLALSLAYSKTLEVTFYPYVVLVRSIPIVTLLPMFIIWFGFGFNSIVVISFLISFFPMVVNTLSGFKSTDDELVEMLRSFSANRREIYRNVLFYSSLPSVFAALKICTILAFTGAIVGEFLIGKAGIGALILSYNSSFETPAMFAGILTVSVSELLIFGAVTRLESLVVDWQ
ncbi:MAG: ABC transporter permease [Halanaeroarchaeum sp.]